MHFHYGPARTRKRRHAFERTESNTPTYYRRMRVGGETRFFLRPSKQAVKGYHKGSRGT